MSHSLLWLSILMFTIYSINARVLNCEDGPEYWCISQKTAKKCNKVNECFQSLMLDLTKHHDVKVEPVTTTQSSKSFRIPSNRFSPVSHRKRTAKKCNKENECPELYPSLIDIVHAIPYAHAKIPITPGARVLNCDDGPAYWCVSKKTAKKCNKENECPELYPSLIDIVHAIPYDHAKIPITPGARVLNCEDGPDYWCISQKTAEQCNKVNECSGTLMAEHHDVKVEPVTTTQKIISFEKQKDIYRGYHG
ncbi:hypothetical protein PV325_003909 [Microctonus aethiopoides]|nr:hypothetical protein PV325_003909 [Microctonus aethiopoides]